MSEQEHNGLSLEGLAQRLEALERENEQMRSENAELRDEVAGLRGSGTRPSEVPALSGSDRRRDKEAASEFDGQVSRRSLLSKAGAAAVAAVAAGTLLNQRQAKATHYTQDVLQADRVECHTVRAAADASDAGTFEFTSIWGAGNPGVLGTTLENGGVGVEGNAPGGFFGNGVRGGGTGVNRAGIIGENPRGGYGGIFEGSQAQLRLVPNTTTGAPTSGAHKKGELYMDSTGTLFVCTQGGTPGTWRRFATTAV
jgi:hypothetical protein